MAYSSGFNPHPRISYAGAAPDRLGQRGGVPRDRPRRGRRPRTRCTPSWTRRCPTASTSSRSWSRPAARWPTSCRPATGGSTSPAAPGGRGRRSAAFLATESVLVQRMTKKGLREFDCRGRRARAGRRAARGRAPGSTWCCDTPCPPSGPDDVLTGLRGLTGLEAGTGAAADPARAGSARRGDRRDRRSAARSRVDADSVGGVRYSPWSTTDGGSTSGAPGARFDGPSPGLDPTTFSPSRSWGGTVEARRRQTATRPGSR